MSDIGSNNPNIAIVYSESETDRIDREQRQLAADEKRRLYYEELRRQRYPTTEEIRLKEKEKRNNRKKYIEWMKETEIINNYRKRLKDGRARRRTTLPDPNSPREKKLVEEAGRPRASACEICGKTGKTVFDHCHRHGHFRAWICGSCNSALGLVQDNPETLRKLAAYLEADQARLGSGGE